MIYYCDRCGREVAETMPEDRASFVATGTGVCASCRRTEARDAARAQRQELAAPPIDDAAPTTETATPSTVKRADENGVVAGGVSRENLFAMQTPQIFARDLLQQAYTAIAKDNLAVTDEVSAVEHLGAKVVLLPNEEWNVKITYPRDLLLAQAVLAGRS
jgi:2-C-methyl-D-erythritol 4-phosphate cytidylyltransferase